MVSFLEEALLDHPEHASQAIEEHDETAVATTFDFDPIVQQLSGAGASLMRTADKVPCGESLPSSVKVRFCVESLRAVLFPGYVGKSEVTEKTLHYHLGHTLAEVSAVLQAQVRRGLAFACRGADRTCVHECGTRAKDIIERFIRRLPHLQEVIASDVQAAFEGDPAATSPAEVIFSYPGLIATTYYRIAHELHELGVPILPRMITEHAHSVTGIDIHPGAQIGRSFFIDHGTGVVVGETCILGEHVQLYQGVTLGAKSFPKDEHGNPIKGIPRHPVLEDNVVVYSGATILGRVTIGRGSVIGGNVWLTRSVPENTRVMLQVPRQEQFDGGGGI